MSVATVDGFAGRWLRCEAAFGTRPWWDTAVIFAALVPVTFGAYLVDERVLNGISVWIKPLKFQASVALHLATLAVLAHLLSQSRRRSRAFSVVVATSAAAALFEIAWITFQAARGRASHFNDQTVVEAGMYLLMGIGSILLVAAPLIMGVWLMRERRLVADPLRLAAVAGLILSAVCTLVVAGYMSNHGGHWVGDVATDVSGLPLFGWSRQVGDLRVAHFFATHAMQLLPLAGFVLRNTGSRGCHWVLAGSAAYAAFTAAVFVQAMLGRPFLTL